MRLRIAKKILKVADVLLEKAFRGRGRLALFIELEECPGRKSPMIRRIAKELGVPIIDLKLSKTEDFIPIFAEDKPLPIPQGWRLMTTKDNEKYTL